MAATASARLLDLTRLVSRLGRGVLTGVDRVELAYLNALLAADGPLFALVRTGAGFLLLDRAGAKALLARADGRVSLGRADMLGRLTRRGDVLRAQAEADMRRLAVARCLPAMLGRMLRRHLPGGTSYLNVGHSNLSHRVTRAVRQVPDARIAVLVHDVIPLDHPEYTRPGISAVFARKMAVVSAHADLVIYSTKDARARAEAHFAVMGRVPDAVVASLGVPVPVPGSLPAGIDPEFPYYVTIGTIEPRKNHALLLDVWQALAAQGGVVPQLYVIGGRGWANEAVFARLDRGLPGVTEVSNLSDGAVAALLAGAEALLFPSHAEGFGLPPVEAAALGTPVFASTLTVLQEVLGDYPVYLHPTSVYSWLETIEKNSVGDGRLGKDRRSERKPRAVPDWPQHFNTILNLV